MRTHVNVRASDQGHYNSRSEQTLERKERLLATWLLLLLLLTLDLTEWVVGPKASLLRRESIRSVERRSSRETCARQLACTLVDKTLTQSTHVAERVHPIFPTVRKQSRELGVGTVVLRRSSLSHNLRLWSGRLRCELRLE